MSLLRSEGRGAGALGLDLTPLHVGLGVGEPFELRQRALERLRPPGQRRDPLGALLGARTRHGGFGGRGQRGVVLP